MKAVRTGGGLELMSWHNCFGLAHVIFIVKPKLCDLASLTGVIGFRDQIILWSCSNRLTPTLKSIYSFISTDMYPALIHSY